MSKKLTPKKKVRTDTKVEVKSYQRGSTMVPTHFRRMELGQSKRTRPNKPSKKVEQTNDVINSFLDNAFSGRMKDFPSAPFIRGQTRRSGDKMQNKYEEVFNSSSFNKNLSQNEKGALTRHTLVGSTNKLLRGDKNTKTLHDKNLITDDIKQMDGMMSKQKIQKDMATFSGMPDDIQGLMGKNLSVGERFKDPGYLSTT